MKQKKHIQKVEIEKLGSLPPIVRVECANDAHYVVSGHEFDFETLTPASQERVKRLVTTFEHTAV